VALQIQPPEHLLTAPETTPGRFETIIPHLLHLRPSWHPETLSANVRLAFRDETADEAARAFRPCSLRVVVF
jgi:hypothetical protein